MMKGSWLIFAILLAGCGEIVKKQIEVHYDEFKPTGILIPRSFLKGVPAGNDSTNVHVYTKKKGHKELILGTFEKAGDSYLFRTLIPLTPGIEYFVNHGNEKLGSVKVAWPDGREAPALVAIYPSTSIVPANLLKIHLQFSAPMQEGHALEDLILLQDYPRDTIKNAFLDLQPELWNEDRTVLTIWFDPGRIKRDLQPNKALGTPLKNGNSYRLMPGEKWRGQNGLPLSDVSNKIFLVKARDETKPDPGKWTLKIPLNGTIDPLWIYFHDTLDQVLIEKAITIESVHRRLRGTIKAQPDGSALAFIPNESWKPGEYFVKIESRLEDLAGNNLERLFDEDLAGKHDSIPAPINIVKFIVKN